MSVLEIRDLGVSVAGNQILSGLSLTIRSGEVHAVMGPNGAGKSTLSAAIMGKPGYKVTGGSVTLDGVDVLKMATWERAVAGLHLVMQYPTEVPGVMLQEVLSEALVARGATKKSLDDVIEAGKPARDAPPRGRKRLLRIQPVWSGAAVDPSRWWRLRYPRLA